MLYNAKTVTPEIDDELAKEIKALCGDGSRKAKFALLKKLDAARADLSTTKIRETFHSALKKHGEPSWRYVWQLRSTRGGTGSTTRNGIGHLT